MTRRRTSGHQDLIATMIRQHGLTGAIDRARGQWQTLRGIRSRRWGTVYHRLKDMRP